MPTTTEIRWNGCRRHGRWTLHISTRLLASTLSIDAKSLPPVTQRGGSSYRDRVLKFDVRPDLGTTKIIRRGYRRSLSIVFRLQDYVTSSAAADELSDLPSPASRS